MSTADHNKTLQQVNTKTQMFIAHIYMSTVGRNKDHSLTPVELLRSWLLYRQSVDPLQTIPTSFQNYQPVCLTSVQTVVLTLRQDSYNTHIKYSWLAIYKSPKKHCAIIITSYSKAS